MRDPTAYRCQSSVSFFAPMMSDTALASRRPVEQPLGRRVRCRMRRDQRCCVPVEHGPAGSSSAIEKS
jgi:hypothetical protein